ncbi:hypothetical protein O0I10_008587 [Lichtheimia ornata]|uniref:Uncharacterized protein n=1 Tax=Lichtheimia ornata TaxID=688661 RepID=A0AAD7XZD9_9FUNG|nr:uncharacterized protein O0I10_008587 [Lichtheimia ornata]KAJ8655702.1 hypothetical protein O0I10_008587 [Lichtheimia ornata]
MLPNIPLFQNAISYAKEGLGAAIADMITGKDYSYSELVSAVDTLQQKILGSESDLKEQRVAILCPSGFSYVVAQWAVWAAGGIAVPLCNTHPLPEQLYTLEDSQASLIIGHPLYADRIQSLVHESKLPTQMITEEDLSKWALQGVIPDTFEMDMNRKAMILYTSGTTGKPKGVVTTHRNIDAQASALVEAWLWTRNDRIHHILPLHHVHGIINALTCALYVGATVEMYPKFDAKQVWDRWLASSPDNASRSKQPFTTFMSVPTVYAKLIKQYESYGETERTAYSNACKQFRFMVSGSASLPTPLRDAWCRISNGQVLLERYGMTELGMALSQPYPVSQRIEGTVGFPLSNVQVRLMAEEEEGSGVFSKDITDQRDVSGMVQVKGPNVFLEYWQRPDATKKEFTEDGWFQTGDYGMRVDSEGYYRILGRASVDILKTGGEKVSALEIERELLSCDLGVHDVAVIGVQDPEWGQRVAAVVVLDEGRTLDLPTMRQALKSRLAVYKVPQLLSVVSELPKNAMGKVTKKELVKLFQN